MLNAYVQPIVQQYFARLQSAFADVGIRCPFSAMQSNGGTASFEWAKEHPITLIDPDLPLASTVVERILLGGSVHFAGASVWLWHTRV